MFSMWLPALLALIYIHLPLVQGQTTNTVCPRTPETEFIFNQVGESPCLVWSRLQSLCIPDSAFVNVPPLVDNNYGYNAPGTDGTACQCNIAAYNLMAACSWCQVGGDSAWSTQEMYRAGCSNFVEDGLGFTQTSVELSPFVWRTWGNDRFDPALAAAAAPSFATTSLATAPTTLSRSFPTVASTGISTSASGISASSSLQSIPPDGSVGVPSATDSPGQGHGEENQETDTPWAIILGSIGGAIAAIIVISMLIFFFFLRRKRRRAEEETSGSPKSDEPLGRGTGRRFDPSYHTSTDWKHKRKSFLDILANTSEKKDGHGKRTTGITELINDPKSFFSPRTPPRPFAMAQRQRKDSNDSIESLRYTTTSERLQSRERTASFGSGSEVSFGVGPPAITPYRKTKDLGSLGVVSPMTARTDMTSTHRGPGGLLEAVNAMKREDEDDPLEMPSTIATRSEKGASYPFPRIPTPPVDKPLPRPPALKSRLSTKIPDSRFSATPVTTLPLPPITPAQDFTLPPEEYRRKQSRQYSDSQPIISDPRGSTALPSLYEPSADASRFSISQRTDYRKSVNSPRKSAGLISDNCDDGESMIFSASTDSRYPSFIPDAQTVQRVKGMFILSNIQFPLPPTTNHRKSETGSTEAMSPQEWNKAKSKAKLTQEVMNIGKKSPVVERGNENGNRKGEV